MVRQEKIDPKQLAKEIHHALDLQRERWRELTPFREAGWETYKTDVFRELAGNRIGADFRNGQFELFFFGVPTQLYFDSAEEALAYVEAVERELSDR